MKRIISILAFCQFVYLNAQTNFSNGYQQGWKEGYCQNFDGISCLPPIPPVAPIPRIGENLDNYKDGYNRGFTDGLGVYQSKKNTTSGKSRTSGKSFRSADTVFVDDYLYKPNYAMMDELLRMKQQAYDKNRAIVEKEADKITTELYNSYGETMVKSFQTRCLDILKSDDILNPNIVKICMIV